MWNASVSAAGRELRLVAAVATVAGFALSHASLYARAPTAILFTSSRDVSHQIFAIAPTGGEIRQLTRGETMSAWPDGSPDGKRVAFGSRRDGDAALWTMDADGANQRRVFPAPTNDMGPTWSPDGQHIAFTRFGPALDYRIYTATADGREARDVLGEPGGTVAEWSPDGRVIAYRVLLGDAAIADVESGDTRAVAPNVGASPTWSADSRELAYYSAGGGATDIYVSDLQGKNVRRLTNHPAHDREPEWSPDGTTIAFESMRDRTSQIYLMEPDGGNLRRVTQDRKQNRSPTWLGAVASPSR